MKIRLNASNPLVVQEKSSVMMENVPNVKNSLSHLIKNVEDTAKPAQQQVDNF